MTNLTSFLIQADLGILLASVATVYTHTVCVHPDEREILRDLFVDMFLSGILKPNPCIL